MAPQNMFIMLLYKIIDNTAGNAPTPLCLCIHSAQLLGKSFFKYTSEINRAVK